MEKEKEKKALPPFHHRKTSFPFFAREKHFAQYVSISSPEVRSATCPMRPRIGKGAKERSHFLLNRDQNYGTKRQPLMLP